MMKADPQSYLCEIHAKFELGQEVKDHISLFIQNSQVLLLIVVCVCGLIIDIQGVWPAILTLLVSMLAKETNML